MNNKLLIKYLSFPESYINDSNYNLLKQLLINYKDNSEGKEKELLERLFDKLSSIDDKEEFVKLLWDFDKVVYQNGDILSESIDYRGYKKEIKNILSNQEINDWVSNIHKEDKLNFKYMDKNIFDNIIKNKIYKSPTWNNRQSSEYYVGILNNKPVYIRKSDHWGLFFTTEGDYKIPHYWELDGGKKLKDGHYQHIPQIGYIEIPTPMNEDFLGLDPEELSKNREEDKELESLPFQRPNKPMSKELRELLYGKKYEPKKIEKKIIKPKKSNFEKYKSQILRYQDYLNDAEGNGEQEQLRHELFLIGKKMDKDKTLSSEEYGKLLKIYYN